MGIPFDHRNYTAWAHIGCRPERHVWSKLTPQLAPATACAHHSLFTPQLATGPVTLFSMAASLY